MSIKCLFGHKWNGCKCEKCGTIRDEQHDWDFCKGRCKRCGKTQEIKHDWNGCKCTRCGAVRNEAHDYKAVQGKCIEKCSICGKEHSIEHSWEDCKCVRCDAIRDKGHKFALTENKCIEKCSICGREVVKHVWDGCKCTICGEIRDEEHRFLKVEGKCVEKCSICGKERNLEHDYVDGVCKICGQKGCKQHSFERISATTVQCNVCGTEQSGMSMGKHIAVKIVENPWVYSYECLICGKTERYEDGSHMGGGNAYLEKMPCIDLNSKIEPSIKKIALTPQLTTDPDKEIVDAEKYLISQGQDAFDMIVAFLLSCASGKAGNDWWHGAYNLVPLLSKFNNSQLDSALIRIGTARSNIYEYVRIREATKTEMNRRNGGNYCPFYINKGSKCAAGGYMYNCSANPVNYSNCNVFMVNPF
jgi:hypothetical protein